MKYKYVWLVLLSAVLLTSCKLFSNKKPKSMPIEVISAFTQKEIPGQQDATIKTFLNIKVSIDSNRKLDFNKVQYNRKIYKLNGSTSKWKIDLEQNIIGTGLYSHKSYPGTAILIYSDENNITKQTPVFNVEQKEDLYLP